MKTSHSTRLDVPERLKNAMDSSVIHDVDPVQPAQHVGPNNDILLRNLSVVTAGWLWGGHLLYFSRLLTEFLLLFVLSVTIHPLNHHPLTPEPASKPSRGQRTAGGPRACASETNP